MRLRATLALGLVVLMAGCGQDDAGLIPEDRAQALVQTVDQIETACADEDPIEARRIVDEAAAQVNELPRTVDDELQRNLRQWLRQIERRLDRDCEAQPEETATPTATATPEETPTETPPADEGGVPAPDEDEGGG